MDQTDKKTLFFLLLLILLGGIYYLFLRFAWIEITSLTPRFTVVFSERDTVDCWQNPCRIRRKAGKSYKGIITSKDYYDASFSTPKLGLYAIYPFRIDLTPKAHYQTVDSLPPNKTPIIDSQLLLEPVLRNEDFSIYAENHTDHIKVFVQNKSGESELLVKVDGVIDEAVFKTLFSLRKFGVLIPMGNTLYVYDFVQQAKARVWQGDLKNWQYFTVGPKKEIIGQKFGGSWYNLSTGTEVLIPDIVTMRYIGNSLFLLRNKTVFQDEEELFTIPENAQKSVWFTDTDLWVEGEDGYKVFPLDQSK